MHRHHENEYEMYLRDCNWFCVFSTEREREREQRGKWSLCPSMCARVCYLEVLHERPRVLDSVVFLQMEHPQI